MALEEFHKYPRTVHLRDYSKGLEGKHVVVEEKMDGTQVGVSFDLDGKSVIQTRGHLLTGHPRERQFDLLKAWVNVHHKTLFELLGTSHIMFGEWLLTKHTVFYDMLPHYFMEFDVLNKKTGSFLTTMERNQMFTDTPIVSVAALWNNIVDDVDDVQNLIGNSLFKSADWHKNIVEEALQSKLDIHDVLQDTDESTLMEGLYIKVEEDNKVSDRIKLIRPNFIRFIEDSGTHWMNRAPLYNRLRPGANLWRIS